MQQEQMIWPDGARIAVSIVVNVEEGSEMTIARGDKGMEPVDELGVHINAPIRNYGNESNYLYGIKAGAPRLAALLKDYAIPATWTAAAYSLEQHPEIAQAIRDLNHEACAHGYRWVHQFKMDEERERAFINAAWTSLERSVGHRAVGWLSRYFHTPNTRRLLIEQGYRYHMDDYSGDVPFWDTTTVPGSPIVVLPYQLDTNDMKMWLAPGYLPEHWLNYAIQTFDQLYREGEAGAPKMMSLGLHLRIIGRPGRIWALEAFLRHITTRPGVWIATRRAIAEHFAQSHPPAQGAA
jgi:allantoinase